MITASQVQLIMGSSHDLEGFQDNINIALIVMRVDDDKTFVDIKTTPIGDHGLLATIHYKHSIEEKEFNQLAGVEY